MQRLYQDVIGHSGDKMADQDNRETRQDAEIPFADATSIGGSELAIPRAV